MTLREKDRYEKERRWTVIENIIGVTIQSLRVVICQEDMTKTSRGKITGW